MSPEWWMNRQYDMIYDKGVQEINQEIWNENNAKTDHSDYYQCGDTFYPSWASDGNLYSPWTDGTTDGINCASWRADSAHTGHAIMIGDDPLKLEIKNTAKPEHAGALPYRGRYPAGSLTGLIVFILDFTKVLDLFKTAYPAFSWLNFMVISFILAVICAIIMILFSLKFPEELTAE